MPRPTIADDVLDRLAEVVDHRTKVQADHLTTTQRLEFVLDELAEADERVDRLADRVESLEEQLEEARAEASTDTVTGQVLDGGLNTDDRKR
jgi:predicted nuclease with TOPRIM domain